jgi:hypothetical protein
MATPDFIKFSRIPGAPFTVLARLEEALEQWNISLRRFARLRPSGDAYDGGLELANGMTDCKTLDEARRLAQGGIPYALSYLATEVRGSWNLYVFDVSEDSFSATISFDTPFLSYESERFAEGEWFKAVLVEIVKALQAEVCGYGADDAYRIKHESLVPSELLKRLREGDLLNISYPVFHAFRASLLSSEEIRKLMQSRPVNRFLKYTMSGGYHVLAAVP